MFSYIVNIAMNVAFYRDAIDIPSGILPIEELDCRQDFPCTRMTWCTKGLF